MTKPADDFEAVRTLVEALESFDSKDRERIIRWACEKLGQPVSSTVQTPSIPAGQAEIAQSGTRAQGAIPKDIKSFLDEKNPKSDQHLAAAVAYYYRFEAPPGQQKESIDKQDLIDACRKADRKRPPVPNQTLVNAYNSGFLDKGTEKGKYHLNSVGENLVAMVLPETKAVTGAGANKSKRGAQAKRQSKREKKENIRQPKPNKRTKG